MPNLPSDIECHYEELLDRIELVVDGKTCAWFLPVFSQGLGLKQMARDAPIMRHTNPDKRRSQLQFVLAGFTEDGTAEAGRYLATEWPYLWDKFVKGKTDTTGASDFAIVIGGTSTAEKGWGRKRLEPGASHHHNVRFALGLFLLLQGLSVRASGPIRRG